MRPMHQATKPFECNHVWIWSALERTTPVVVGYSCAICLILHHGDFQGTPVLIWCHPSQYSSVPLESRQLWVFCFLRLVLAFLSKVVAVGILPVEPISIVLTVVNLLMSSSMFVEYDFYRNISESFQSFGARPDWSAFVISYLYPDIKSMVPQKRRWYLTRMTCSIPQAKIQTIMWWNAIWSRSSVLDMHFLLRLLKVIFSSHEVWLQQLFPELELASPLKFGERSMVNVASSFLPTSPSQSRLMHCCQKACFVDTHCALGSECCEIPGWPNHFHLCTAQWF